MNVFFKIVPQKFFLIDSAGAFLTAFLLFLVLRPLNEYIGIPKDVLSVLSLIAILFCLYSLICFFLVNENWRFYLRLIGVFNLLYCCLTLSFVVYFYAQLTILGLTYFLLEIVLIAGLVCLELSLVKRKKAKN